MEHEHGSACHVAAFAGLVPGHDQSGTSVRGKPILCKMGSERLRKAIYFPAIVAMRHNPIIKAMSGKLRERGKCQMMIIGAAMRKLIHIAFEQQEQDREAAKFRAPLFLPDTPGSQRQPAMQSLFFQPHICSAFSS